MAQTKAQRRVIARQARAHGYFRRSEREGYVFCPVCRAEVTATRYLDYDKGRYETWPLVLDRAMLDHLDPDQAACLVT